MTKACNLRMNRIIRELERHQNIQLLNDLPESIEFPASFHEKLFSSLYDLWKQNNLQYPQENIVRKIVTRKDFPLSLHERNFIKRGENQFYFFAALHVPHLTVEQIEMLFDEFFQAGGFNQIKENVSPWETRIKHLIEEKFDERLMRKYVNNFQLTEGPEYFKKVLQYFNEDELFDFLVSHENVLASVNHLSLLSMKDLSNSLVERIMKHCEKSSYLNPMKDKIKMAICHDPKEIHRAAQRYFKKGHPFALTLLLANPFTQEKTIVMTVKQILSEDLLYPIPNKIWENEKYGFVFDKIIPFVKNCIDNAKRYNTNMNKMSGFYDVLHKILLYAPIESSVNLAKTWLDQYPIFDHEMIFPRLMARGVENETLWQKFLKSERVFINENEFRSSFWNSIPLKFLTLVSPEDMGTEPLLGIYARKELPDDLRNALFDEIKKRMGNESGERFDTLTSLISNVLLDNDTLPKLQSDIIKEFVLNHMGKEIETFIPCSYFSNTDLIKKMVSLGEENEDLKIQILESGVFPEFLRESFDAPPEWEKRQENRTEVSASI